MPQSAAVGHVLIVDDNRDFQATAAEIAKLSECATTSVSSLDEAKRAIRTRNFDLVMLDLSLPDGNGLDLLDDIDLANTGQIAVVTGNPTVESAVRAVRGPIVDYLIKPISAETISDLLERARLRAQSRAQLDAEECGNMIGQSPAMQAVFNDIRRVAPLDVNVLVVGESGTGKELAARAIHAFSGRSGPFVPVNCGAVAPDLLSSQLFGHERGSFTGAMQTHTGFLEQAQGGTLFLDEITEMPTTLQVYLLRVLEMQVVTRVGGTKEIPLDCRIIAATNRDPEKAVQEGRLRSDLYFRLMDFPIHLPPLRERSSDIPLLAQRFVQKLNARYGTHKHLSAEALKALGSATWSGNVRELRHVVQRAFILADDEVIGPPADRAVRPIEESDGSVRFSVGMSFEEIERVMLMKTLAHYRYNKRQAARALGITAKTIYNRLAYYREKGLIDDPNLMTASNEEHHEDE